MGYLLRNTSPIWQEMADFGMPQTASFSPANVACNAHDTAANFPGSPADDCLICYPSLDRFVPNWRLPVAPFAFLAKNGWDITAGLVFLCEFAESRRIITPNKGRKSCLRHPTSSQQLRCFPSQLASKMTANAQSLAQASAALLAKLSATTTVSKARLLAASLAHCPTTSKSICLKATEIIEIAAAGQPCARRFCF